MPLYKPDPETLASGFSYEAFGGLDGFTYGNGVTLALGDDLDGRLVAMDVLDGLTPILDLDYTHDLGGRITDIDDIGGGNRGRDYAYDNLHRLTQARELAPGGTPVTLQTDYTYDAVGNRLTRDAGGTLETLAYDAFSNRLDTVTAGATVRTLGYTASGNTASDDDGAGTALTLVYDSTDRLVEVKQGTTTIATYLHNAQGKRVAKAIGATTTHYIYGPGGLIAEANGSTGTRQAEYVWLGGVPLAYIQGGTVYYVHPDHLGTPQRITDGSKAVVWDASYRPFGEATVTGALTFNLRFPGQYLDSETELHYNNFRDYDAGTGRYVQSDPIGLGDGWNMYGYVKGNPVMRMDPTGQNTQDVWNMINLAKENEDPYDGETLALPIGWSNWFFADTKEYNALYYHALDIIKVNSVRFPVNKELCCEDLKLLYEVLVHESIHRTACWKISSVWSGTCVLDKEYRDAHVTNHTLGDAIYREGARRAAKQYDKIEERYCIEDDNGCDYE